MVATSSTKYLGNTKSLYKKYACATMKIQKYCTKIPTLTKIIYRGMHIRKKWLEKFDYIPMGLVNLTVKICKTKNCNKFLRSGLICMDKQHPERKQLKADLKYRF